jgi:cytochrome c oxidase assembly factor CtaG/putative copper export protein
VRASDRWRWVAGLLLVSVIVLVVVLEAGGGAPQPVPAGLPDPGPLTGWLLPASRLLADLAEAATIGLLMAPGLLLPSSAEVLTRPGFTSAQLAVRTATVWALVVVVELVLTVSDILGMRPGRALDPIVLRSFVTQVPQGRVLLAQVLLALVVAVMARSTLTSSRAFLVMCVAAVTAALPTLTGHSAASGQHELAIASLMVHVVCAALWVGGLLALLLVTVLPSEAKDAAEDQQALPFGLARFSNVALVCWIGIGVSGVVNASVRLSPADLVESAYGVLVLFKVLALVVLGSFGWWHRQHTVAQLQRDPRRTRPLFARVAALELLVMGATFGLAVGLSRTPTPASDVVDTTPAYERLGFDLPPAPDLGRLLGGLTHDGFALVLLEVVALAYALGVRALHRSGEHWPGSRTLAWYAGVVVVGWATVGGLGLYAHVLFSLHLVAQMLLSVLAPILLVLGSPLTLAQLTLPGRRTPRERGLRQLLQLVLDSRTMRVLTHPVVTAGVFAASLYVVYLTPLFDALMLQHLGHSVMQLWFLASGCLLFWQVLGNDDDASPRSWSVPTRAAVLLCVAGLQAGCAVLSTRTHHLLAADYYEELHRPYATGLLADQHHGAYALWLLGVLPLLALAGLVGRRSPSHTYERNPA